MVLHASTRRADYQAGHVPGARFLAWNAFTPGRDSLTTELPTPATCRTRGSPASTDASATRASCGGCSRAGVALGQSVVTYCHIGIQVSVAYVAARSLGLDVSLYDGSFEDWSRRTERPVEGPAAR